MQISPTTLENFLLILSIICLSQVAIASSSSSSTCDQGNVIFSFPATFDPSNCEPGGDLLCMGTATLADGFLNLTTASVNSSSMSAFNSIGRVLYRDPIKVWPGSFCTSFSFKIFPRLTQEFSGDGMTFVMAQDNKPSPSKSFGSYLGLQDPLLAGKTKFQQLAIEMDTFKNEWDIDGNHIAIDTQSVMKSLKSQTLNSSNIVLKSGKLIRVKIVYDDPTKMLQVYVGYSGNPLTSVLSHPIEMSRIVPSQVYLGFTASSGTLPETHHIHDWIFTSTIPQHKTLKEVHRHKKKKKKKSIILLARVVSVVGGLVLFAVIASFMFAIRRRIIKKRERIRKMEELEKQYGSVAPTKFTYKQLAKATKNFSKDNLLGTGGFGSVYKGHILDPPQTIAVKKISSTSRQGEKEYLAEICTIGRLRHRNILQLQGWSHENDSLLLVYDFMINKSLNEYISGNRILDWITRHKILTGIASALLYLHEEYDDPVVHRDVKPSNVMLDTEFNPRLGDFGLARLLKNATAITTAMAGTLGYMAPEVSYTGKATTESDVYSFGVLALEVVCGKRCFNLQEESCLVDYAWDMHTKGTLARCVDPRLGGDFDEEQAVRIISVALACLHLDSNMRPKMRKVVMILLNSDEPLMELPATRPKGVYVSFYGFSDPSIMTNISSLGTDSLDMA